MSKLRYKILSNLLNVLQVGSGRVGLAQEPTPLTSFASYAYMCPFKDQAWDSNCQGYPMTPNNFWAMSHGNQFLLAEYFWVVSSPMIPSFVIGSYPLRHFAAGISGLGNVSQSLLKSLTHLFLCVCAHVHTLWNPSDPLFSTEWKWILNRTLSSLKLSNSTL